MLTRFNPLNHPVICQEPRRLTPWSAWHEHMPFAMLIVDVARPLTLVELGTHAGDSYCAFCQAVSFLQLRTRCTAVDTWVGDEHSAVYGPEILSGLRAHHDPLYGAFSELRQSTFDAALATFPDHVVDVLHIDGLHSYEAVRHDFDAWLPKVSARGIVLLHDTAETAPGFGVKAFWEDVRGAYPSFEFGHGHGLGVLAVGRDQPEAIREMLSATADDSESIRRLFEGLGRRLSLRVDLQRKRETLARVRQSVGYRVLRRLGGVRTRLLPPLEAD